MARLQGCRSVKVLEQKKANTYTVVVPRRLLYSVRRKTWCGDLFCPPSAKDGQMSALSLGEEQAGSEIIDWFPRVVKLDARQRLGRLAHHSLTSNVRSAVGEGHEVAILAQPQHELPVKSD